MEKHSQEVIRYRIVSRSPLELSSPNRGGCARRPKISTFFQKCCEKPKHRERKQKIQEAETLRHSSGITNQNIQTQAKQNHSRTHRMLSTGTAELCRFGLRGAWEK